MRKTEKNARKRRGLEFNEYQALRRAIKYRRSIPIHGRKVVVKNWKHAVELGLCNPLTRESKGGRPASRLAAIAKRVKNKSSE